MSCVGQVALSEPVTMSETASELESVVRTHARLVFRVAYSVLRNREDAEDAAQETYIRLMWQDLRKIEDPRLELNLSEQGALTSSARFAAIPPVKSSRARRTSWPHSMTLLADTGSRSKSLRLSCGNKQLAARS